MPVVVMRAADLGVTGYEDRAELEANEALRTVLEKIRLQAGELMGLGDVSNSTVPKLAMVAAPRDGGNICTRTFIPHRCHDAIGVLGAVSVATAAFLPDSPGASVLTAPTDGVVRLEHPTGHFDAVIEISSGEDGIVDVPRAGIIRTARKLIDEPAPRVPARTHSPRPAARGEFAQRLHTPTPRMRRSLPRVRTGRSFPVLASPHVHAARLRRRRFLPPPRNSRPEPGRFRPGELSWVRQLGDGRRHSARRRTVRRRGHDRPELH